MIMLMQKRGSRASKVLLRSHSQPPCLRRREVAHYGMHRADELGWPPHYHLCPFDWRWRFGCTQKDAWRGLSESYDHYQILTDEFMHEVLHVRSCVEGAVLNLSSFQQTEAWSSNSFLSLLANCQSGFESFENSDSLRHSGTPDCRQGCRKVHLGRMNVPETLRPYHRHWTHPNDENDDAI